MNELKAEYLSKIETEYQKITQLNSQTHSVIQFLNKNEEKVCEIEKEINYLKQKVTKERNEYLLIFRDQLLNILQKKAFFTEENDKICLESEVYRLLKSYPQSIIK